MKLDVVHDVQSSYRKLIESMSRPGLVSNIGEQAARVDIETGFYPSTTILMFMLLDTEVTFHVMSKRANEITKLINQLTYAKAAEADNADYLFVLGDADPRQLEKVLRIAKVGDLKNPHESATVIIETSSVTNGNEFVLTGPGIAMETTARVNMTGEWLEILAEKNVEYPLGIDLILTDENHELLCLPRTSQILKRVAG
ncbi:phosphonate C-P lyase system protein PhnH [Peribacillus saganii]|uniref:Phosphonate C-P lyase system protein PhnH n=1 Tax=Peribacillus saganii TaxID=2303992 RepID=A0A372LPC1_9BACI|nr:phosphonate C-P lyase system protein PhnH [Peribacillus saganii]RFU68995.1 phosphonate C-P lyase system protein PhnH [Peribacillus saganii]